MPLEIKEIVVTASFTTSTSQNNSQSPSQGLSGVNKDDLIAECVEQVLEILKEKNER